MCAAENQVVDAADVLLPRTVQPLVCLLVQFQAPRQAVPNDDVSAILQIQPMPYARRMCQRDENLTAIPCIDIGRLVQRPAGDALLDADDIMAIGVEHKHRITTGFLDQLLQRIELDVVQIVRAALKVINRTVCKLQELIGERRFGSRDDCAGGI